MSQDPDWDRAVDNTERLLPIALELVARLRDGDRDYAGTARWLLVALRDPDDCFRLLFVMGALMVAASD